MREFFGLMVGLVVGMLVGVFVAVVADDYSYKKGQIDALNNQWLYQKVTTSDGATSYVHLTKATTRPAEAR